MNVLVLSPALYDRAPGPRFRIEQWARHLQPEGYSFTFVPFGDEVLHRVIYTPGNYVKKAVALLRACICRFSVLKTVKDYDLVFLHREAALIGPAVVESLIARHGVPIVYDFDDPIWMPYQSPTNALFTRLKWQSKTQAICRLAARVVVGNRLLAGWAAEHASQVDVVPSTIDMDRYPAKPAEDDGGCSTLGWTGSHSTLPFLQAALGSLARVAATHPFRLLVIAHTDQLAFDGFPAPVVARRWRAETEATDLHAMDVGLAPFPNTGWTPWRCHGKVLQYMAAGIPTVASKIGILPDYIQHGVNGLLADSDAEWDNHLATLLADRDLRTRIGLAGRKTIEERYSAQVWLPKVREILASTARH